MIPNDFLAIANHLWQSTLFAATAGLMTLFLRNNRAHVRFCLWLAASVKFLVPFSLLMLVGGLMGRHSVILPSPASLPVIVEQVNEPFASEVTRTAAAAATAAGSKAGTSVVPVFVALWAIGCGAFVLSCCMRWRRMKLIASAASPIPLGIGVPVLSSASIFEPGVFGVFRPALLLPSGIGDRLAPAELQAILAHELCHVRRRDNLSAVIHMVVEAVFWFHPLVWWLGSRLIDERERACDEEVLRRGNQAEAYAEGILKVCELYLQSPLECASGVTGSNLKKRIEAIMANRPEVNLNLSRKAGLMFAGFVAIAIPVILGITHAPELRAQTQVTPAQEITGDWQGKLPVPQAPSGELRLVFRISKVDGTSLKAVIYSIDQEPAPTATIVSVKGSTIKLTIPAFNAVFEGTLGTDGNTINGKFTQRDSGVPLNLVRATAQTAWAIPEPPSAPKRMPANAKPEFAVATIKPTRPEAPRGGYGIRGEEVTTTAVTVNWMIKLAFNVHAHQISGGPAWLDSERYDTVGKPDIPGQPNRDQMKFMVQKLLADRFQLRFHTEKKELPVYAMVVAKGGPKITVSAGDPNDFPGIGFGREPGVLSLVGRNTGLNGVANGLQSNILDKPVVDQTLLTGRYDFTLRWTPDPTQWANFGVPATANPNDLDAPPDIFTAFEQQLGLKLQPTRAVVDVMVIDRIERPSPN